MAARFILTGPTASGKGEVAHLLARRLGGEIVLLDSMKVYREMDIVTAKPSPARRAEVPYHLLDLRDPAQDFSVGEYLPLALKAVEEIEARGRPAIFCGGTALYLNALLNGLFIGPDADWALRRELSEEAEARGPAALHQRLTEVDPAAAGRIHPNDRRRIIRALEVRLRTGEALTRLWQGPALRLPPGSYRIYGIEWDRPDLYRRIDARVVSMVEKGLFEEARRLRLRPGGLSRAAAQCIGCREVLAGDETGSPREEVISGIQRRTRQFAKQQMTWFRRFAIKWLPGGTEPAEAVERILAECSG